MFHAHHRGISVRKSMSASCLLQRGCFQITTRPRSFLANHSQIPEPYPKWCIPETKHCSGPNNFNSSMTPSTQKQTALAVVAAFNSMDVDSIISHRSPGCMRHILPSTLNLAPMNNTEYQTQLQKLIAVFLNFNLTVHDIVEDREAHRIVMWLKARADTLVGEYVNEYMWTLDFDDTGEKIIRQHEFVDTVMNRDFWPKLSAALKEMRKSQMEEE